MELCGASCAHRACKDARVYSRAHPVAWKGLEGFFTYATEEQGACTGPLLSLILLLGKEPSS
eukprot:829497-Amphidinium_carterae.1